MQKRSRSGWSRMLLIGMCGLLPVGGMITDVAAADLFAVELTVDNETQAHGFSNAEDALRSFEDTRIETLFPNYDDTSFVLGLVNFRGLHLRAGFSDHQSPTHLFFHVPSLEIEQEFRGRTRDESVDLLVDFLKKDGGELLQRIQRKLARVSPVDPIAGNPNSLQSTLVKNAFQAGASGTTRLVKKKPIGIGVSAGTFQAGDYRGLNFTLPLSYAFEFGEGSRKKELKLNVPLTYIRVEGGDVFSASPGVALTVPVGANWSLTPAVNYGVTGSVDVASVGQMLGSTLTSRYAFAYSTAEDVQITLGNMIGYVSTLKTSINDFDYDPGITNTVYKNGVSVESPLGFRLLDDYEMAMQVTYAHTYFAGTDLFLNQYHEVALSVGSGWDVFDWLPSDWQLGVIYTFGDDYKSINGNFGYNF